MAKFGLHAYTVALRQELALLGIRVVGVYPGAVFTDLSTVQTVKSVDDIVADGRSQFTSQLKFFTKVTKQYVQAQGVSPATVARPIVSACLRGSPNTCYPNMSWSLKLASILPQRVLDAAVAVSLSRKRA